MRNICFIILLTFAGKLLSGQSIYEIRSGRIHFISSAPLETIEAVSNDLQGLVDVNKSTFAFSVQLKSFEGFNSPLQKEHFHENYMESDAFPKSTFTGKLIDKFDPSAGKQTVRAKGFLEMHGISRERIIQVEIVKTGSTFRIKSDFNVLLEDHDINIPKIVYQKISEIIKVQIEGNMTLK